MIYQVVGLTVIVAAIILGIAYISTLFDSWLNNRMCEHCYEERFKIRNKNKDEAIICYRCCYCGRKINIKVKEGVNRLPQEGD